MGDDATLAESAPFSLRRSRHVEQRGNPSMRTNSAAPGVGSVALVILPQELAADAGNFRTSERGAALGESPPICFQRRFPVQPKRRPSAALSQICTRWATMLFRKRRPHFCFAVRGQQTSERKKRGGGISAASQLRCPPRAFPRRRAKSDVREPIRGSRRSCRVAMAAYEETTRSGLRICAVRYFDRVAMDNSPG